MRYIPIVLAIMATLLLFAVPACAGITWENNITVRDNGMTWTYEEEYRDTVSLLYRNYIDSGIGNNDSYVSAWEVLMVDCATRKKLHDSIIKEMDVEMDNSSKGIHVTGVDAEISHDVLGRTTKTDPIGNTYLIEYAFDTSPFVEGANISFRGEPWSNVTIAIPDDVQIRTSQGVENRTRVSGNNLTAIKGVFGSAGSIIVTFGDVCFHTTKNINLN
ncbi:MAG: hypothetical protein U9N13_05320 [Euryarchaeota archaeon]|nr:hypothetical protein [Euryarchaeota archaeon]